MMAEGGFMIGFPTFSGEANGIQRKESHMKTTRIVIVAALMVSSAWALRMMWAGQVRNTLANENREDRSNMTNEKVIMLIEANIQSQRRVELVEAVHQYLPLVRAEPGVEAFYVTAR